MTKNEISKFIIEPSLSPRRTDLMICEQLSHMSRAQVLSMIKSGEISRLDNIKIKASKPLFARVEFLLKPNLKKTCSMAPQDLPIDIIYSDEHLAIINKPVGLVVHPGAGQQSKTLCNALLYNFPHMQIGDATRPGIVHRLDKNTSGIMVVAKTHLAHRLLSDMFKNRQVHKSYRAFCFGEFGTSQMELITGHARHPHNRLKFFTGMEAPRLPTPHVRLAHTSIKVIKTASGISELELRLHTGRTHQIRAHLCDINHALLGDDVYGGLRPLPKEMSSELKNAILALTGQALHAETLEFIHPFSQIPLKFTAPLPKILQAVQKNMA